ncbi:hypothetical protein Tco_0378531, partial [Tanacetum coccineum]
SSIFNIALNIKIRHHFIRDANEKNLIQVLKIHTNDNVADLLTKAFDGPRFEYLVVHIGMVNILPADIKKKTIGFCWSYYGSAGSYPFCWTIGFCWSTMSVGSIPFLARAMFLLVETMVLLVVILSAGRLVSAGRTMILL